MHVMIFEYVKESGSGNNDKENVISQTQIDQDHESSNSSSAYLVKSGTGHSHNMETEYYQISW
jgi:hypothetical protein